VGITAACRNLRLHTAKAGAVSADQAVAADFRRRTLLRAFIQNKKMLGGIKAGDKVRFRFETVNNAPTVTQISPMR